MSGFGMCCGCGGGFGSPTLLDCVITCTPTDYCTQLPQTYCFSLAGVAPAACLSVGDRYSTIRVSLCGGSCPTDIFSYVNTNPDRVDICNPFVCNGPPWTDITPTWQASLGPVCTGTAGGYTLTEPMMILWIRGDDVYNWDVYYGCPLDGYDCTGANIFDLLDEDINAAADFSFPATLTLTPCSNPAGLP